MTSKLDRLGCDRTLPPSQPPVKSAIASPVYFTSSTYGLFLQSDRS
ncbi:MAG: hypothetical protein AB4426_13900 [Xenococcaceae cyanobacterium]